MSKRQSRVNRPTLERISWIAGVASALIAVLALVVRYSSGNSATVTATGAPVVITQQSPNAHVVVNVPPERRKTDQDNCTEDERWVGMTPSAAEWSGKVTPEQAKQAVFYGELRWSPELHNERNTTRGEVQLEVDGRRTVIYKWDSPSESTHAFTVKLNQLLVGTSGRFKIRWVYKSGKSGVCVAKSYVGT